jgi:MYXO-CTERM domain-containing protein
MSICNRLLSHTVLAVSAAVSFSGMASAAVSGWNCNLSIPANTTGLFFNVETSTSGTSNVPGWDLQIYSNSASPSIVFYYAAGAGVASGSPPSYLPAANLALGTVVGSSTFFTTINDGSTPATFYGSGPSAIGMWYVNAVNYFGFKFTASDGYVHYGFGQMTVGANANTRTLNFLAYETFPGAPITVTPAPGVLGLAGLCGLARSRRRR